MIVRRRRLAKAFVQFGLWEAPVAGRWVGADGIDVMMHRAWREEEARHWHLCCDAPPGRRAARRREDGNRRSWLLPLGTNGGSAAAIRHTSKEPHGGAEAASRQGSSAQAPGGGCFIW